MLCLQNGKFDATDRMFHSMPETWESSLQNPTDLKELIPEFFCGNGDFLTNMDDLDLGRRHTGERLDNVELPPWAKRPQDFVRKMRQALESEHVSANLHHWIDLVFGYKQKGQAAVESNNLYYYLTYEGSVDLEQEKDIRQRAALEAQIQEFGQTPKQLFADVHPSRNDIDAPLKLVESSSVSTMEVVTNEDDVRGGSDGATAATATATATASATAAIVGDEPSSAFAGAPESPSQKINKIQHWDNHFEQEVQKALEQEQGSSQPENPSSPAPDVTGEDSPAMRHMSSLFGQIKGKTASFVSSAGWFGSSLMGDGGEGVAEVSQEQVDGGDICATPASERLTSSNYKSKLRGEGTDPSLAPHLASWPSSDTRVNVSSATPALSQSQGLHPVDATHLHANQCVTALCMHDKESTLCSVGEDQTLKIARLGSKTLCVASVAETSLPPGTYQRVGFNTTGSSLVALACGATEAAFMCTFSVDTSAPETPPALVSAQRVCGTTSSRASCVNVACAPNDLLDFRAHAVSSDTKVSKSFYVVQGTSTGAVYIRSVSHVGVFGPEPAPAFTFQPFGKDQETTCTSLNGDRVLLAAGSSTGKFSVTNVESRKEAFTHQCSSGSAISCIQWLRKGRVAFATRGGDIVVSDTSSSALASITFGFKSLTSSIATGVPIISMGLADAGDDTIVCGCGDGSLRVFSLVNGISELHRVSSAHDGAVTSVLCSATAKSFVASGGADGFVKIWRIV